MAKCRMLIQENQELGRQLSQGRVAQLEAELALQKKYSEELKTSQDGEFLVLYFLSMLTDNNLTFNINRHNIQTSSLISQSSNLHILQI